MDEEMKPEQALAMLVTAAHRAQMNYADHISVERAGVVLAEKMGLIEAEKDNGKEEVQI